MQTEIYEEFSHWLDSLLENNDMPENTVDFNFNLYEQSEEDSVCGIQLIAADRFDPENGDDWACCEAWSSEEDIFCVSTADEDDRSWQGAQKLITEMISEYLENGKYGNILTAATAVGVGFVDGDIDIIYRNDENSEN